MIRETHTLIRKKEKKVGYLRDTFTIIQSRHRRSPKKKKKRDICQADEPASDCSRMRYRVVRSVIPTTDLNLNKEEEERERKERALELNMMTSIDLIGNINSFS